MMPKIFNRNVKITKDLIVEGAIKDENSAVQVAQLPHIGTIPDEYQGQPRETDKLRLTFELTDERKEFKEGEGEKPFSISQEYTFSMGEKANLRKTVEGLLGTALHDDEAAAFELEELIGRPCLLNVVHQEAQNGKTYARIKGASPLPKGMTASPMFNIPKVVDVTFATDEAIEELPDFLKGKIKTSKEWLERHQSEDDLPFN